MERYLSVFSSNVERRGGEGGVEEGGTLNSDTFISHRARMSEEFDSR